MSLLARLYDFMPGNQILSGEVDNEYNQLFNCLNGTSTDKGIRVRLSDAADPPIDADQLSTGLIGRWKQSGVVVATVTNAGSFSTVSQFISSIPLGTAPMIVASSTKVTNLNADLLDGLDSTSFLRSDAANASTATFNASPPFTIGSSTLVTNLNADKVDGFDIPSIKVAWSTTWFYATPPAATEGTQSVHDFSVPTGAGITATKLRIIFTAGSHTSGGVLTFTVFRRSSAGGTLADLGTVTLNNTNNTAGVTYETDITDVPLSDGDRLSVILTTRTGTITEQQICVIAVGTQQLGA